jgi:hypothetical protein
MLVAAATSRRMISDMPFLLLLGEISRERLTSLSRMRRTGRPSMRQRCCLTSIHRSAAAILSILSPSEFNVTNASLNPEQHKVHRDLQRDQISHTGHAGYFDEISVQGYGDARMGGCERERLAWLARKGEFAFLFSVALASI